MEEEKDDMILLSLKYKTMDDYQYLPVVKIVGSIHHINKTIKNAKPAQTIEYISHIIIIRITAVDTHSLVLAEDSSLRRPVRWNHRHKFFFSSCLDRITKVSFKKI